jgi:hypothetical protein
MEYRLSFPMLILGPLGLSFSILVIACIFESIGNRIRRRGRRSERRHKPSVGSNRRPVGGASGPVREVINELSDVA